MRVMELDDRDSRAFQPAALVAGTMLLALGAGLLLDRAGLIDVSMHRVFPGAVLIVLGSLSFADGGTRRGRRGAGGLWLIGVGCWMLISQLHLFGHAFATSWPLFIILAGFMLVVRGWR